MSDTKVPIASQIAEVQRELALRKNVYAERVRNKKMRESEAELCTRRMHAVLDTLIFCQRYEKDIRAFMAARKAGS